MITTSLYWALKLYSKKGTLSITNLTHFMPVWPFKWCTCTQGPLQEWAQCTYLSCLASPIQNIHIHSKYHYTILLTITTIILHPMSAQLPKNQDTLSITSLPTKLCPKCRIPDPLVELVCCLKLWSKIIESVAASSTPPNSQLHIAHGTEDTQSASRSIHTDTGIYSNVQLFKPQAASVYCARLEVYTIVCGRSHKVYHVTIPRYSRSMWSH